MYYLLSFILFLGAYSVGSLPTGYIIASLAGISDIRKYGSGNIGATNVARVLGISYFIPVFIIDAAKAAGYLFIVQHYSEDPLHVLMAALLLLIGNGYSLFLSFTGGKGIATSVGILYAVQPSLLFFLITIWTCVLGLTGRVGIASAAGCASLCILAFVIASSCYVLILCMFIGLWGIWRHQENLRTYMSLA